MSDHDLIKLLWTIIKANFWHDTMPDEETMTCVVNEVHTRGIEIATYLDEVQ